MSYPDQPIDAQYVQARLEEAGATLLALPAAGYKIGTKLSALIALPELDAPVSRSGRWPVPSAARIDRMDEAFAWLALIPSDKFVLRRIVGTRALTHPITGKHCYSWAEIGEKIRAHPKAVSRWHADGISWIVRGLVARERRAA